MIRYAEAKRKVKELASPKVMEHIDSPLDMAGLNSWYGETPLEQVPVYGRNFRRCMYQRLSKTIMTCWNDFSIGNGLRAYGEGQTSYFPDWRHVWHGLVADPSFARKISCARWEEVSGERK
jgi:hypothetical protein